MGEKPVLDPRLQAVADRLMTGRQGALLVLDVSTGKPLARAGTQHASSRLARPGSAIKPFSLLTMLEAGAVKPDTRFRCTRALRLAGREMDCTHPETGTPLGPVDALAYSCNSFFAQAALRMDAAGFARSLERFGLSAETGGSVRVAETGDLLQLQAVGEYGVEVTPLTMAAAYRGLASADSAALKTVMAGLRAAVEYGTAQLARPGDLPVAGKTGTAMSRGRAWSHGWFCGFAPTAAPKIVVTVFLENGSGGADAAPLARTILEAWRDAQ